MINIKSRFTLIKLTIILLLLCSTNTSFSQNRLNNTTALEASGGYVNGGWNVNLGAEFILNNSQHSITLNAYYIDMKLATSITQSSELKVPVQDFTVSVGYAFSLCKYLPNVPLNILFGGGMHIGYENFPKQIDEIVLNANPQMTYGLNVLAQFEVYVARKVSLTLSPRVLYNLANSSVQPFMFIGNVGVKINL